MEHEYCQSSMFEPICGDDEVILVLSAQYGRIRLGKCVSEDFANIICDNDVLPVLDAACSGRRTCSVRIEEPSFPNAPPCHNDLKSSLVASYTCLKGKQLADICLPRYIVLCFVLVPVFTFHTQNRRE